MRFQYGTILRNFQNDQIEVCIGVSPKLQIRDGTMPANCGSGATGQLLCEMTLPADWMSGSSSGTKNKAGTWEGTGAIAGTAKYFRIIGTTFGCQMQGDISEIGGDGAMTMDTLEVVVGEPVIVVAFSITGGNA